jgi:geranyl-CoA carboxylase alpha subunit
VHPGYGFLAENETSPRPAATPGLVFIGPSPEAITAMGNKAGAKRADGRRRRAWCRATRAPTRATPNLAEAARIGWPVMIKATAGGGGRGMRLVDRAADFAGRAAQRADPRR